MKKSENIEAIECNEGYLNMGKIRIGGKLGYIISQPLHTLTRRGISKKFEGCIEVVQMEGRCITVNGYYRKGKEISQKVEHTKRYNPGDHLYKRLRKGLVKVFVEDRQEELEAQKDLQKI